MNKDFNHCCITCGYILSYPVYGSPHCLNFVCPRYGLHTVVARIVDEKGDSKIISG
jgi:3-methyladenine DNA glycosylase Mpg